MENELSLSNKFFFNATVGKLDKFLEHLLEQTEFLREQMKSEDGNPVDTGHVN